MRAVSALDNTHRVRPMTRFAQLIALIALLHACDAGLKNNPITFNNQGILTLSQSAVSIVGLENTGGIGTQNIAVTDVGGATVPAIQIGTITYSSGGSNWVSAGLSAGRPPAQLVLSESALGLLPGIYVATVPIYSDASLNSPQNVVITMQVDGRPVIGLSPDSVFFTALTGGANPAVGSVNVTNLGPKPLNGLKIASVTYAAGQPSNWLTPLLNGTSAPTTLDLQATTGALATGTYTATVTVGSTDTTVSAVSMVVQFDVTGTPARPRIGVTPGTLTFSAPYNGPDPAPQTININNSGNGTLSGLAIGNITYGVGGSGWVTPTLANTTGPTTLQVQTSVAGLGPGLYTAAMEVTATGASNTPKVIPISLNVIQDATIQLTPANVNFVGVVGTGTLPAQSVSITNSGGGTLNQLQLGPITYGTGQPTNWLTVQLGGTTAPTTVTLKPTITGLPAGTYNVQVQIRSGLPIVTPTNIQVTLGLGGGTGTFVKLSGDGQSAFPDSILPIQLVSRVYDASGNPKSGVTTTWTAAQGIALNVQAVTNNLGEARASWKLGPQTGVQSLQVTTAGLPPVTFTASAVNAPGANPGEPPGFNLISDRPFDAKVEDGWTDRGDPRFSIVQDATAPRSPQNIGDANWTIGFAGGVGPISTSRTIGQFNDTEIYISFWIKLSSNWIGAPSNGINKVFHIWINGGSVVVFSAQGQNSNPIVPQMRLQNVEDDPRGISFNLNPNIIPGARLIRGQWHRVEVHLAANTPGFQDGRVEWWLDGTQIASYSDVGFISPTNPVPGAVNWQQVQWNPTWGAPADHITASQDMYMDHIYISGHH